MQNQGALLIWKINEFALRINGDARVNVMMRVLLARRLAKCDARCRANVDPRHPAKHYFKIWYTDANGRKRSIALSQSKREAWYVMLQLQGSSGRTTDKSECCVFP